MQCSLPKIKNPNSVWTSVSHELGCSRMDSPAPLPYPMITLLVHQLRNLPQSYSILHPSRGVLMQSFPDRNGLVGN